MSDNREDLNEMDISALRKLAQGTYGIAVMKAMDRDTIINLIRQKEGSSHVTYARKGKELQPGWSRIIIDKVDPNIELGGKHPVYVNVNNYPVTISRGVEVDVPNKIYDALLNAVRLVRVEDESEAMDSSNRVRTEEVPRHPVKLIARVEGPNPRNEWENQREAKLRPFKRFYEEMGFWPSPKVLKEYVVSGQFRLSAPAQVFPQNGQVVAAA